VPAAHASLIKVFGGPGGVRDLAVLKAALARPQSGYYRDVIEQAAALLESLSQNHPFIDGNKRTSIAVTAAFLHVNGYRLEFEEPGNLHVHDGALRKKPIQDSRILSPGFKATPDASPRLSPPTVRPVLIRRQFPP
jgi:death-on-curing family protein